ncbi:hypothetical protein SUGI_1105400 [Cryptomeria japonica]|nr:hypothetical protein SUGI_1105400 [Cryptomeria japonica]
MKTVCVVILGWVLFDSALSSKNIMGMLVAIVGMIIYSWAVQPAKQASAKSISFTPMKESNVTDEDVSLRKSGFETNGTEDIELGGVTK